MLEPAPRQRAVLVAIDDHRRRHGHAPTITELMATLGLASKNGIADHLKALAKKGLVTWERRRARTLALTRTGRTYLPREAA